MAYLWKLLYQIKYFIKYVTYALFFLVLCIILHLGSVRDSGNYEYSRGIPRFRELYNNTEFRPKYILVWKKYLLMVDNRGRQTFPTLQCRVSDCVFTEDRDLLGDYSRFDALLFSEDALKTLERPQKRTKSQIYIFSSIESAYNAPACEVFNDDFYNWTFTYRLDSDVPWTYFIVRNVTRHTIAPKLQVDWKLDTHPITPSISKILRHKKKAAAWLVSHCKADSMRDDYITRLQEYLFHFSLKIDVFGACSNQKCKDDDCEEMFTRDYYFYLAFENSFSVDYVSEKVLHGYNNYVVPIVYGGADYNRFLPPGSYLNARGLHPYNLAYIMHQAMNDPAKYEEYFRWTNIYTVDSDLVGYHPLCNLCEALNSERARQRRTYKKFRVWWNGLNGMKWCLPEEYWNETSLVNVDGSHLFEMY